jgi:catalase
LRQDADKLRSPALSMDKAPPPPSLIGRKVAVLLGDGVDAKEVQAALAAFAEAGLVAETIGPHGGTVATSGKPMKVNRAAPNAPSVIYDAVFVPAGMGAALAAQPLARRFVHEAYRHGKPIAVAPDAERLLEAAGVPPAAEGIAIGQGARLVNDLVKNMGQHRFPRRVSVLKPS